MRRHSKRHSHQSMELARISNLTDCLQVEYLRAVLSPLSFIMQRLSPRATPQTAPISLNRPRAAPLLPVLVTDNHRCSIAENRIPGKLASLRQFPGLDCSLHSLRIWLWLLLRKKRRRCPRPLQSKKRLCFRSSSQTTIDARSRRTSDARDSFGYKWGRRY